MFPPNKIKSEENQGFYDERKRNIEESKLKIFNVRKMEIRTEKMHVKNVSQGPALDKNI